MSRNVHIHVLGQFQLAIQNHGSAPTKLSIAPTEKGIEFRPQPADEAKCAFYARKRPGAALSVAA